MKCEHASQRGVIKQKKKKRFLWWCIFALPSALHFLSNNITDIALIQNVPDSWNLIPSSIRVKIWRFFQYTLEKWQSKIQNTDQKFCGNFKDEPMKAATQKFVKNGFSGWMMNIAFFVGNFCRSNWVVYRRALSMNSRHRFPIPHQYQSTQGFLHNSAGYN